MSLVDDLSNAIARFEGFFSPGTVAQRNNNPGNLRSGPGQTGTDAHGYAIFPDPATGWAALNNQVSLNVSRGLSLQTFFGGQRDASGQVIPGGYAGYAPSADANNPTSYANTVAGWLGIDPTVPLSSVSSPQDQSAGDLTTSDGGTSGGGVLEAPFGISWVAIAALAVVGLGVLVALRD